MKSVRASHPRSPPSLALAVAAAAQEGHPLAGTWYGDYGTGNQKRDLTVIMKWDGQERHRHDQSRPEREPDQVRRHEHHAGQAGARGPRARRRALRRYSRCASKPTPGDIGLRRNDPEPGGRQPRITGTWTRGGEKGTFQIRRL